MTKSLALAAILAPLAAGGLGGCAQQSRTQVYSLSYLPNLPISELYDGSYQGRERLVAATVPECPVSHQGVLEIGDATLNYAYTPAVVFAVPVQRDGKLHGTAGKAELDGRIANDELAMRVKMPGCETDYWMHYVWNHS